MPSRLSRFLLLYLLSIVSASMAMAQQSPEATTPPPEAAKLEVTSVAAAEIAGHAAADITGTRELVRAAAPDDLLEQIAEQLPTTIEDIEAFRGTAVNAEMDAAAPKLLEEAQQQWQKYTDTLDKWGNDLHLRATAVQDILDQLAEMREVWRITAIDSVTVELPEAVQEQVRTVEAELLAADDEVRQRQEYLLNLQNKVSEQSIAITTDLEQIRSEIATRQNDLFRATAPPIWSPWRHDDGSLGIDEDVVSTWVRIADGVAEFWGEYRTLMLEHLVLFLLLVLGMWQLAKRAVLEDDSDLGIEAAKAILGRPVASAGLLTMIVMGPLYMDAPSVIHVLYPLTALAFAIRITSALVPPERRRLIYGVLALAALTNIQQLIVDSGLLRQTVLLLVPVTGLIGLEVFRRRVRREQPDVIWPNLSLWALILGNLSFLAIFAAAALGFIPVGEHLAASVIESAYIAFVLLAGYRVADALLLLLLRTAVMRRLKVVQNYTDGIRAYISRFVRLASYLYWLWALVDRLLVTEPIIHTITAWLTTHWEVGSMRISLGAILLFILVLWGSLLIAKIVRHLLEEDVLPRAHIPRGRAHAISMLFNYGIVGLGFVAAMASAGIKIEQFALIGGALGVGIGFGLQNVVSNFVSGLILVFERPVQVGDTVEVGTLIGTVRRIGIRSSTVRTFDEAEVIVPNSDFISSHVVNWTLSDQLRRMEVKVGVKYGTDPVTVQEILVAEARKHAKVLEYPSPYALFKGFGDSSLEFVVRFWTSDFGNWIFIASEVTVGIDTALREAGITIPFPQRDLHIYSVDPPAPIPNGGRVEMPRSLQPEAGSDSRPPQMDGDE